MTVDADKRKTKKEIFEKVLFIKFLFGLNVRTRRFIACSILNVNKRYISE